MEAYQPAISFHSSGQYEIAVAAMATGEVNKGFGSRRERGGILSLGKERPNES